MKKVGFLGLAIALAMIAGLNAQDSRPSSRPKAATSGHVVKLTDITGKKHDTSKMKDQYIVLEWTESGCPAVIPHYRSGSMQKLAAKYMEKGVAWYGVCSTGRQTKEGLQKFVEKYKVKHPILTDFDGRVGKMFKAARTPHMFILKNGEILYQGAIDDREDGGVNYVAKALDELLAGKDVSTPKTRPYG
ncbi:MAG: redoxin family protein [Planctomycetota bacterium]